MRLAKITCLLSLVIMVGALFVNCSSSDKTSTTEPTPTQTAPDFIGGIIEVNSIEEDDVLGTILVEGEDIIQSSDKYIVTIKAGTLILEQDGKVINHISFADLQPGQSIRIWFSGAVRESYPAQVDAAQVMIIDNQNDEIKLGNEFQLAIGQRVELSDTALDIVFKGVTDDSRCPANARCVWQGEVTVDIELIGGDGSHLMTMTQPGLFYDFSRESYAGYEILFKVLPYPETERQIKDEEYRLVMKVIQGDNETTGTLQGHVTIGPIEPVVRPGDDPKEVPHEVYDARKIMVYDEFGEELIEQVDIGHDGYYSVELLPGTYLVDINNLGIDYSDEVPTTVTILAGETIYLDVDIDTGIR